MIFYWLLCVHIMSSSLMHIHKPTECLDAFPYSSVASSLYFFFVVHSFGWIEPKRRTENTEQGLSAVCSVCTSENSTFFCSFRIWAHEIQQLRKCLSLSSCKWSLNVFAIWTVMKFVQRTSWKYDTSSHFSGRIAQYLHWKIHRRNKHTHVT